MGNDKEKEKLSPLEEAIVRAMKAIDNQVAREMQRSPAERDAHGVQKWKPYDARIESLTAFILNKLGENEVELDSLLVLSQSFARALRLVVEDLGQEGLGDVRSEYCRKALETLSEDGRRGNDLLRDAELM